MAQQVPYQPVMSLTAVSLSFRRILQAPSIQKCRSCVSRLFGKYLLVTNVAVSATFSVSGDFIVQEYDVSRGRKEKIDLTRSSQVAASGAVVGLVCHYWYLFLDARFPGRTLKSVITKVAVDQAVCSPVYLSCFLATTCYLEDKTFAEFSKEFKQKGWRLYLADCAVWPPAQLVNFYLLPLRFRVLFDNVVSLGFDIYTSYVKYEIPLCE